MKKIYLIVTVCLFLAVAGLARADQVSFIWDTGVGGTDTLQGVDSPAPAGWSNNNNVVNLNTNTWSLLSGNASVNSYQRYALEYLTHRGTRGLGVSNGEFDEVDSYSYCRPEKIIVNFNTPYYLNSFEVRSLFNEFTPNNPHTEVGAVDFWLNGSSFFTETMSASENIWDGGNGVWSLSYNTPSLVDKLVFYVPSGYDYSSGSEFALAKLNVSAVPEPVATVLFLLGGATLAVRRLRKKTK